MGGKAPIFLFMIVCLAGIVSASTLNEYNVDFYILYKKMVVEKEMVFDSQFTGPISLDIPSDASGTALYLDDSPANFTISDGKISFKLSSTKKIKLNYVTRSLLDKSNFLVSMSMPYDVDNLKISLRLPENAFLEKPFEKGTLKSNVVFPAPSELKTDGQSIILIWERIDLKENDDFSIYVNFKEERSYFSLILALVIIIVALVLFIIFKKTKVKTIVKTEEKVEGHLKEDEEIVVNVLKQREGKCEQGTLRVITGFSKAKLSALLKELEERKIVIKEKRGKKNLVFLRK